MQFSQSAARPVLLLLGFLTAVVLVPARAHAGFVLTAEAYDTPGMPGFQTFDITATIEDGYFMGFNFVPSPSADRSQYGVTGSLFKERNGQEAGAYSQSVGDSGFLVDREAGLELFSQATPDALEGLFSYTGGGGQLDTHRQSTFLRVVTDAPESVRIFGELGISRYYSDGGLKDRYTPEFDTLLSQITLGGAPELQAFPDRPTPASPVTPTTPQPEPTPPVTQPDPPATEAESDPPGLDTDPQAEGGPDPIPDAGVDSPTDSAQIIWAINRVDPWGKLTTYDSSTPSIFHTQPDLLVSTWTIGSQIDITEIRPTIMAYDSHVVNVVNFNGVVTRGSAFHSQTPEPTAGALLLVGSLAVLPAHRRWRAETHSRGRV